MTEEDFEREAESLADDAVAGFERLFTPDVIAEMRRILIFDLLASTTGRAELRRAMPDPVVEKSGDLADEKDDTKAGGGVG